MLKLWRKTVELLRKYPILWVPYLCADLAASFLIWLRRQSFKVILYWVSTTHLRSVLGGDLVTTTTDSAAFKKAMLLSAPLSWTTSYVNACLYVAALIVTASLVAMILRGQKPELKAALTTLRAYPKRILIYGLIFCALTIMLGVLIGLPISYLLNVPAHPNQWIFSVTTIGGGLLTLICSAWIMAPLAIALIRPADAPAVSAERKKLGRIMAIAAGMATIVLGQLSALLIIRHVRFSHLGLTVFNPLNSLVVNSPFILLFVALTLIAAEDSLEVPNDGDPKAHRLLETVMPLHFGHDEKS